MSAILREGGETGNLLSTGWFQSGATPNLIVYTSFGGTTPRKDFNSNGGNRFFGNAGSGGNSSTVQLARDVREVWIRVAVVMEELSIGATPTHFAFDDSGGTNQVNLFQPPNATLVSARRNATTLGNSAIGALPEDPGNWVVISARIYIDNVNGEFEVFKDYNYSSPLISLTGIDTQETADNFARYFRIVGDESYYDDLAVNDATIVVDTTAGTVSPGDTVTGNNTGTTAVVTSIVSGSGSGQAILQLHFVRVNGTDAWNDPSIDPWSGDTQLTTGGGWAAQVLAPKTTFKDENSGPVKDGYIVAVQPSADVAGDIQLVRAGVDTGANFSQVAAIPATNATALQSSVETVVPGERDIYELEDLTALGFAGGEINGIQSVMVSAFWQRDGSGLNNGNLVVENGGVEFDGPSYALGTSALGASRLLSTAPDGTLTGATWDESTVNALRIGIKFTG